MLNTNTSDLSNSHNTTHNDALHDENMDSYVHYIEQSKSDSQELSFEQLQSYYTADDNERDRMWDENEPFCKQCYQQGKYYIQESVKRSIQKHLDEHGDIYIGDREVSLHYIHMRLEEDISEETRDELCNIAGFLMNDSEENTEESSGESNTKLTGYCHTPYGMFEPSIQESVELFDSVFR